jgi:superfamily II DNA/RNA helicase
MAFKKLNETLQYRLTKSNLEQLTELQKTCVSKFKQGADFIAVGPESEGKTTAIVTGVIEKLRGPSEDDAPRAVIVVKDSEKMIEMEKLFQILAKRLELRIVTFHDKGQKVLNRIELYEGSDIVIGTAKRMHEMYLQNGLNMVATKLFIVDDAEFILDKGFKLQINRLMDSLEKCQFAVFDRTLGPKSKQLFSQKLKTYQVFDFNKEN